MLTRRGLATVVVLAFGLPAATASAQFAGQTVVLAVAGPLSGGAAASAPASSWSRPTTGRTLRRARPWLSASATIPASWASSAT